MPIERLDHVNLRTAQLDQMIRWYVDVLGLTQGPRPDFGFAGAWLYAGDVALVHLVAVDAPSGAGSETPLKMEHVAFRATDEPAFRQRLEDSGSTYRAVPIGGTDLVAYNVWDPDGNHLHVDFATA
ncbi:MAG: VOC family protein [Pseudomonadota bacterium]